MDKLSNQPLNRICSISASIYSTSSAWMRRHQYYLNFFNNANRLIFHLSVHLTNLSIFVKLLINGNVKAEHKLTF